MKARIRVLLRIFAGTSIARRGRSPSLPQEREREKREEKERRERGRERERARAREGGGEGGGEWQSARERERESARKRERKREERESTREGGAGRARERASERERSNRQLPRASIHKISLAQMRNSLPFLFNNKYFGGEPPAPPIASHGLHFLVYFLFTSYNNNKS